VIVRISKLGWFEGSEMKDLVGQSSKFMGAVTHAALGLRLLTMLVTEMNEMLPGATLSQHRKICTSFRDRCLLPVFQIALTAHRQVLDGNVQGQQREVSCSSSVFSFSFASLFSACPHIFSFLKTILAGALELSHKCLSFDFIGTQPVPEKSDEAGTIQVPNTWRDLFEAEGVLRLFFQVYRTTSPSTAKIALQCLTQVASVRRSVFTGNVGTRGFFDGADAGSCGYYSNGNRAQRSHQSSRVVSSAGAHEGQFSAQADHQVSRVQ
jgi:exportin-7